MKTRPLKTQTCDRRTSSWGDFFFGGKAILRVLLALIAALVLSPGVSLAAEPETSLRGREVETAFVVLDASRLFPLRGIQAYPAKERARAVADRIRQVAANSGISVDSIAVVEEGDLTNIVAGDDRILSLVDADAVPEGITRHQLAVVYTEKIRVGIRTYREARTRENLVRGILYSAGATVLLILAIVALFKLFDKLLVFVQAWSKDKLRSLGGDSVKVIGSGGISDALEDGLKMIRFVLLLAILSVYTERVLRFFPWTQRYAVVLLDMLVSPLKTMGSGIVNEIPDLIFLAMLVIVVRLLLKFMHVFFRQVQTGTRVIAGFYPEWARPTDRIVTFLVIAFAAVVAFPYVPGSSTAAFKGISLFIGVIFSLGSQSTVSNIIAGFVVHYRRAFKEGDRVKIQDVLGDVVAIRMQVVNVRTTKNEDVIVPHSTVLNSNVVNYSSLARQAGLILHTEVTIGYDTPWRQVEALLLAAASRTEGAKKEPAPFVLQKGLEDFYVRYELNVYTDAPQNMMAIYSELHRNIQDCFNEHGVQIMSPHYLGDPAAAKIVPMEDWHKAPARPPDQT